jgi:hypothetical protein
MDGRALPLEVDLWIYRILAGLIATSGRPSSAATAAPTVQKIFRSGKGARAEKRPERTNAAKQVSVARASADAANERREATVCRTGVR